ncbi:MAG TPA: chromosomal replication initiator protein DnaA [Desulfobulbaceae bacterium]|nr:MAG: chromosomal replication initiator protein DnaA [Deltaproteobacteria bacterium RIFOXYD12_FULL_53_23]HCC55520.1 chromosomal replication initiator protein DnaA [Desulfobulbaceae bacterium]
MLWQRVKSALSQKFSEQDFKLWIEPLQCAHDDAQSVQLAGPDLYFCSWVKNNYLADIQAAFQDAGFTGEAVRISVNQIKNRPPEKKQSQLRLPSMPVARPIMRTLHPRYIFPEFMVGESNALAYSACEAIANGDSTLSPCLFIEAGTGLGKSHLTHAVAHHITGHFPGTRLHYVTSQQLTSEMVRNIKNNTMEQFKEKYHHQCDVLLMEDVQTLAGRIKTQSELAEALDVLMDCGKRIIFTGSVSPRHIPDMDDGVRSRLSSGLITTINPPDWRTRCLIIERKARNNKLALSGEIIEFLADRIQGDIRRVESTIIGLKAKASLHKTVPDLDMVKEIVAGIIGQRQDLSAVLIRNFVAGQFKVSIEELQSKGRRKTIAFPRQVSMYLARKLTEEALSEIGKAFNRDHSTVVHSIRVITDAIVRNGSIRGQVDHLVERLKNQG